MASTSTNGKVWRRVRVVDDPLTDYQRYQLASYRESQAVGEEVLIARRAAAPRGADDFWLFDAYTPTAFAVLMRYDNRGRWLGAETVDDTATLTRLVNVLDAAIAAAEPLNVFLVGCDA